MTKSRGIRKKPKEGDIKIFPSNNTKWKFTNGKWVYIKKPKDEWIRNNNNEEKYKLIKSLYMEGKTYNEIAKIVKCSKNTVTKCCQELKFKFPPIKLPDHIKPTNYPHYYISNDGIAFREPRQKDAFGQYGKVNEYGLIQLTTHLRGNSKYGEEFMYESVNIYFYDETGKNIGSKKKNIHQLVAETWIPNPHGYNEILHGIKGNRCNHVDNLRWGTHAENMKEASSALPEGSIRTKAPKKGRLNPSQYKKVNGEWVLIPSDKPAWNKGLKGSSWNTLPDGSITTRKVNGKSGTFIKQNGEWIYQKKRKSLPDGTVRTYDDRTKKKIDGKWVYQRKENPDKRGGKAMPDGTITTRSDGTTWIKIDGKWIYQKKKKNT